MLIATSALLTALFFISIYGWFIEPRRFSLKKATVRVSPGAAKHPVAILFASDFHISPLAGKRLASRQVAVLKQAVEREKPGLIALGGDFFDRYASSAPEVEGILKEIASWKVPTVAVLGNHDYSALGGNEPALRDLFAAAGVTLLVNEWAQVKTASGPVDVFGLKDVEQMERYPRRGSEARIFRKRMEELDWISSRDSKVPRVLLTHNPDGVYLPASERFDVVLAGHTHGGQFWPLTWIAPWVARIMPAGSFLTWAGERLAKETTLITSRGIGGSAIPFRLTRRPELHLVTLEPYKTPASLIVGVAGKARSGKDTASSMLLTQFPSLQRVGFSYVLKKLYDEQNGTDTLHDEAEKDAHRAGLNAMGDEIRAKDPEFMVRETFKQHALPLLISDVRTPLEFQSIRDRGGVLIRIQASRQTLTDRTGGNFEEINKHATTETALDAVTDWDYEIINDGTLDDLERAVKEVCRDIVTKSS